MRFLADVELVCEECRGTRYKSSVMDVHFKEKTIHDVLQMTVREALAFFAAYPKVTSRLRVLEEVGLGYLRLGQSGTTSTRRGATLETGGASYPAGKQRNPVYFR